MFSDLYNTHVSFCRIRGLEPPSTSTLAAVCARLGACRLLLVEAGEMDVHQRVRMNCNLDDVSFSALFFYPFFFPFPASFLVLSISPLISVVGMTSCVKGILRVERSVEMHATIRL